MLPEPTLGEFQAALLEWYAGNARPLPWREPGTSPWAILVCEIMSQQTPVARVAPAWFAWLSRWPTPADLAAASPASVLSAWGRLGYPRRALRLRECAIALTDLGFFPDTREELLALPGIGPYTADALLAFAFTKRSTVLDTNIRRVLSRIHGVERPTASSASTREYAAATAHVPLDPSEAATYNAAIMELGALVCTSTRPNCGECPVRSMCGWREAGYPANGGPAKTQGYAGTHREARGKVMAALRHAFDTGAAAPTLDDLHTLTRLESSRLVAALASLVDDGLVAAADGVYTLPHM